MMQAQARAMVLAAGLGKRVASPEGELVLLADINFSIFPGEGVAIVGPSGAGKSTLLGLLAGLDVPSAGHVALDGIDLNSLDEDGRAQLRAERVGFVFQSFHLLPNLTALENTMLPLELVGRRDARSAAMEVLARVNLGNRLRHYPNQLSGGEQQRVAIARAFVAQPKILFADEPTGNLDSHSGQRVIEVLFAMNQEQGTTLILVTHDENLAQRCGRRLRLLDGHLQDQT